MKKGESFFDNKDYEKSIAEFKKVSENDESYNQAQMLLIKADSLIEVIKRKDFVNDSIFKVKEKIREDSISSAEIKRINEWEIEKMQKELNSIKTFDGAKYRGDISSLKIEIALFSTWGKMAENSKNSEIPEKIRLGKSIEQNLKSLQLREFPKIRANYAKILKNKLWEEDITVQNFGSRKNNYTIYWRDFLQQIGIRKIFKIRFHRHLWILDLKGLIISGTSMMMDIRTIQLVLIKTVR